jgi:hypothetical protein
MHIIYLYIRTYVNTHIHAYGDSRRRALFTLPNVHADTANLVWAVNYAAVSFGQ